jgi:PAS domain S-box-containing protein
MEHTRFVFDVAQFNRLFPFYLLIDEQLCIQSFGSSFAKITNMEKGVSFTQLCKLKRPSVEVRTHEDLKMLCQQLLSIEIQLTEPIILRGQLEYLPTEAMYLFVGSPWFGSVEEVKAHHLVLNDFAIHDSMIDLLHAIKTQDIATQDMRLMLNKMNTQVKLLKQNHTELQRLSLVAKASEHGVVFIDTQGKITWHNDGFSELTQFYSWEILGKMPLQICKGKLTQMKAVRQIILAYRQQIGTEVELILYKKTQAWFWASVKIQPIKDEKGNLKEYFAIIEDITPKKLAEEQIKASENRLSSLISNFQSGILLEDETRHIVLTNEKFCAMFGIPASPAVLRGLDCSNAAEESKHLFKNPTTFVQRIDEILLHKENVLGDVLELVDGRFYERDYIPIFSNKAYKGHLWIYSDITERKNYEKNLIKQEEKYRNIIANMNLGLLEVDLEERILYANQSFCVISGYELSEIVGKKAPEIFIPIDNPHITTEKQALREAGKSDIYQIQVLNRAGEQRWWLISGAPRYDEAGNHIGSIGIHLDITDQKEVEAELEIARKKAEESSIAKEQFLANMSHEIRTPLNAIIGMARELAKTSLNRQQNTYLKHTYQASQHLLSIVNNILDISKIEAGQLQLESHDFRLSEALKGVEEIVTQMVKEKMLDFQIEFEESIAPALIGDSVRIRQILINLLSNAVKFTEKGTVGIICTCKATTSTTQTIQLTVWDTGIGMEGEYLDKLFSKFSQENSAISRKYGGTGLGMAITYELVQLMNGEIYVKSEKGIGTRFEVLLTLPIGNEQNIQKDEFNPTKDFLQGKRVLLVEDNELNRLVATQVLAHYRVKITEATNGQEAIDVLKEQTFDAILMDLQMPVMDGLDASRFIRRVLKLDTPIIALTANAFKTEIEKCMQAGMNDYVTKPFEENILINVLQKALNVHSFAPVVPIETAPSPTEDAPLYDISKITQLSKGNPQFIKKMIDLFVEHTPPAIAQIKLAYETQDLPTMRKTAHRIKPSLDNLRITQAMEDVRALEGFGENNLAYEDAKQVVERLEKVVQEVVSALAKESF